MDLTEALARCPGMRAYRNSDQEGIFRIFEDIPMRLPGCDLIYDRRPDFEAMLRGQGPHHQTLLGEWGDTLLGFASMAWGPRWVDGKASTVSYIGDLRVIRHARALRMWRDFYPAFLDCARDSWGVQHHLTAVLADNQQALRSLAGDTSAQGFLYHLLRTDHMVNVLATNPLRRKPRPPGETQRVPVSSPEAADLVAFMDAGERGKLFGAPLLNGEWERRLQTWPKLAEGTILAHRDARGLRAVCVPWSSSPVKRLRARHVRPWLRASLWPARILGVRLPGEGEVLGVAYLTHLHFAPDVDNAEKVAIIGDFVRHARREPWVRKAAFVSFGDAWAVHREPGFRQFVTQVTGVNLYAVTRTGEAVPTEFFGQEISFEMALA